MTTQLVFNNTPLSIINLNNQIWITSNELAKILNYSDSRSITNLTDNELLKSIKPCYNLTTIDIVDQK